VDHRIEHKSLLRVPTPKGMRRPTGCRDGKGYTLNDERVFGVSGMKVGRVFVMLAVVLAVVGAGLSYSGYNDPLQVLTVTSTRQITVTSPRTVSTVSREFVLMTTSSTNWILQDEIIDIAGVELQAYCGRFDVYHLSLDPGQVHVSYHTDSVYHQVDFWMMNDEDYTRWSNIHQCTGLRDYQGLRKPFVAKLDSSGYEFTTEVSSAGVYYFGFLNKNKYPITVTLSVDAGLQTSEVTLTRTTIVYSTQAGPYVTEQVTVSTRPVGFGLLFYAGIGLIAVAVIGLAISRVKKAAPGTAPPSASVPVVHAGPVVSPPPAPTTGKFCINCGAPLPAHAVFCNKCGSKQ
jgi:hypothetical protein